MYSYLLFFKTYYSIYLTSRTPFKDDVYSLLLNTAISLENLELVRYILDIEHEGNILTSVGTSNFSPISTTLYSDNPQILDCIIQYIEKIASTLEKTDLVGEDYEHIRMITETPAFESIESADCLSYLSSLYTETSLRPLIALVEEDAI